jgi:DNA-binding transcriptional LysR family regulator
MTMVEAGLGISILAELVLRRTNFNIVALPIDPPITRTIAIGYKDKDSLPIASKYFIEYLTSNIDKLP